jgi:carotenoid cleavage dioxygenase-like enzyme
MSQPFHLTGNYAPLMEEITATDLPVHGSLPPGLNGSYVRNGPNPMNGPTPIWFLGQGMLHGVRLAGGRAGWYRNRTIRASTTANTNVVRHAGRVLALVETAAPVQVNDELETIGAFDFAGRLPHGMTAHPKTCPASGELLFFTYSLQAPHLTYYRASAAGELLQSEPIVVASATYMHDFAITAHNVLFFDLPVLYNGWRSPVPIQWSADYGARIGVMPRQGRGDEVRWFPIEACTISHTLNAFERGHTIVLDVVRAADLSAPTQLFRYTLDLRSGTVQESRLDPMHLEFPRIDDRRAGLPYRYAYALELRDVVNGAPTTSVLRKFDLASGSSVIHDLGPGRVAGECVFVPRSADAAEDDGYAITLVYDRNRTTSDLVVCEAQDFAAPALATVSLPTRVPFGIHGNWFADPA